MRLTAIGGILGAIAASSCCIAPLVLFSLGISGAWIGNLTALAPYQPYFIAATLACLGYGCRRGLPHVGLDRKVQARLFHFLQNRKVVALEETENPACEPHLR